MPVTQRMLDGPLKLLNDEQFGTAYPRPNQADSIDITASNIWRERGDMLRACRLRVLAARNFEVFAEQQNGGRTIRFLENAAISYDRAAKNAEWAARSQHTKSGTNTLLEIAIRCRVRSCRILSDLIQQNPEKEEAYTDSLGYARRHIASLAERYSL